MADNNQLEMLRTLLEDLRTDRNETVRAITDAHETLRQEQSVLETIELAIHEVAEMITELETGEDE